MQRRKGSPKVRSSFMGLYYYMDSTARITAIDERVLDFYRLSIINKVVLALLAPGALATAPISQRTLSRASVMHMQCKSTSFILDPAHRCEWVFEAERRLNTAYRPRFVAQYSVLLHELDMFQSDYS